MAKAKKKTEPAGYARVRIAINNDYLKTCARYIDKAKLHNYEVNSKGDFIYRYIDKAEYDAHIKKDEPLMMREIGIFGELDPSFKVKG